MSMQTRHASNLRGHSGAPSWREGHFKNGIKKCRVDSAATCSSSGRMCLGSTLGRLEGLKCKTQALTRRNPPSLRSSIARHGIRGAPTIKLGSRENLVDRCRSVIGTDAVSTNGSGGGENGNGNGNGMQSPETFTVDDALDSIQFGTFQTCLMFYLGLGWVADAMEVLLLSFLSPGVACEWNLTASEESWITGVVFVGMACGAYTWGSVSDTFGRKAGFLVTSVFTGMLGIASAFAPNYTSLLVIRGLVGFGLAGAPQMYAMFSEFTPTKQRSTKLLLFQMFWSVGAIIEAGIAWYFMPNYGWRGLVLASSMPFVVLSCLYPWVPESPRFLALQGKLEEATEVLQSIAKVNKTELPPGTLVGPVTEQTQANGGGEIQGVWESQFVQIRSLLSKPLLKTTLLMWTCWVGASLGYYGVVILTTEVHTAGDAAVCMDNMLALRDSDFLDVLVDTAAELPAFAVAIFALERAGRKWSIACGFLAAALAMSPLLIEGQDPTAFLFFTRLSVSFVFATIFVYTPEIYPTSVRAMGMGIASLFSRAGGLMAPFVSQQVLHSGGLGNVAGVYILSFLASGISASQFPLDTKGELMRDTVDETEQDMLASGDVVEIYEGSSVAEAMTDTGEGEGQELISNSGRSEKSDRVGINE
ncbi:hypothetical protein BSKO_04163 [Bryopsis sp. KO-2023]|nr:hypothetical protein BSKO_04163 [Bryopsis sp. KO-2023]